MIILWHRTAAASADNILREGFRDGRGRYMTDREFSGVWLADRPLDSNEGAWGDTYLLKVTLDCAEDEIADFEWIEEGKPHREWLIPAPFLEHRATVSIADHD